MTRQQPEGIEAVKVAPHSEGGWLAETWSEEAEMYLHSYGRTRTEALRGLAEVLDEAQRDPAACKARAAEWMRAREAMAERARRRRRGG